MHVITLRIGKKHHQFIANDFCKAIYDDDRETLERFLQDDKNYKLTDTLVLKYLIGITATLTINPLMIAVAKNNIDQVRWILSRIQFIDKYHTIFPIKEPCLNDNDFNYYRENSIAMALQYGYLDIFTVLVDALNKANGSLYDCIYKTTNILQQAVKLNAIDFIMFILSNRGQEQLLKQKIINPTAWWALTADYISLKEYALQLKHFEIARMLDLAEKLLSKELLLDFSSYQAVFLSAQTAGIISSNFLRDIKNIVPANGNYHDIRVLLISEIIKLSPVGKINTGHITHRELLSLDQELTTKLMQHLCINGRYFVLFKLWIALKVDRNYFNEDGPMGQMAKINLPRYQRFVDKYLKTLEPPKPTQRISP